MLTMLKLLFGTFVGAAIVLMLTPLAHAIKIHAINITDATLSPETVTVSGNKAAKSAVISWEGKAVTISTKGGAFKFKTAVVPEDCIGTLTDGVSTVSVAIAGCTVPPPPPPTTGFPATGQTTCWDGDGAVIVCAGTGHDGDIRAGVALSFTDNGDGTITDNNTGLMWAKKSDDGSIHDKDTKFTWVQAFAHVVVLNAGSGFAGHSDWRLPNAKELQSIVNYENLSPSVSPAFNTGCVASCTVLTCSCTAATAASIYWSSTTSAFMPSAAWTVDFGEGNMISAKQNDHHVRAVRGGL